MSASCGRGFPCVAGGRVERMRIGDQLDLARVSHRNGAVPGLQSLRGQAAGGATEHLIARRATGDAAAFSRVPPLAGAHRCAHRRNAPRARGRGQHQASLVHARQRADLTRSSVRPLKLNNNNIRRTTTVRDKIDRDDISCIYIYITYIQIYARANTASGAY